MRIGFFAGDTEPQLLWREFSMRPCNSDGGAQVLMAWADEKELFRHFLRWRWSRSKYSRLIDDHATHALLTETLRKKYVCPDYLELVGVARPEHLLNPGGSVAKLRQAELLLVGAHRYRGLWIGTHEAVAGYHMDTWGDFSRRWTRQSQGWYVATDYRPPRRGARTFESLVSPFRNCNVVRLEEFLVRQVRPLATQERVRCANGNSYDCRPENLEVYSIVGRPMRCKGCGESISAEHSVRVRIDGTTQRYCFAYLKWMEKAGAAPELDRCIHRM